MKIITYPLGQLQANCYFIVEDTDCLIIDPADSADFILEQLILKKLNLVGMIATHGHFDHTMAAGEISMSLKVPLSIDHKDLFLLKRLEPTARHFLGYDPVTLPPQTKNIKGGPQKFGKINFEIIKTPGHTPGALCIYFKDDNAIFTGDTLFQGAIGRYDFSYSSKVELDRSLAKLFKLPEDTIVYPGHGETTTIDLEKEHRNSII